MIAAWQITLTRDDITLGIAPFGVALGLWNAWSKWRGESVRLKVIPKMFMPFPERSYTSDGEASWSSKTDPRNLCVEIQNKGVPVTISEAGFLLRDDSGRCVIMRQFTPLFVQLPYRLEKHSSVTIYSEPFNDDALPVLPRFKCAYVDIASGQRFTGANKVIKHLRKLKIPSSS